MVPGDPETNNKNIQPRHKNRIWYIKMYHADYEKEKKEKQLIE